MPLKVLDLTQNGSYGVLGLPQKQKNCTISGWYLQWGKWQVVPNLKPNDVEIKSIKENPFHEFKVCVFLS